MKKWFLLHIKKDVWACTVFSMTNQGSRDCEMVNNVYSRPKPLAWVMAFRSLSLSLSLLEYSGNRRTLKHVWAVGNLQEEQTEQA